MKTLVTLAFCAVFAASLLVLPGEPAGRAQSSPDLIIAFSGDLRGYLEECG